eukprot:6176201-Pleurochrysis_carterae.AAC.1
MCKYTAQSSRGRSNFGQFKATTPIVSASRNEAKPVPYRVRRSQRFRVSKCVDPSSVRGPVTFQIYMLRA